MNPFGKPRRFTVMLGVLGLAALGEGWCLCDRIRAAREARTRLELERRELRAAVATRPAPTVANAAQIEADLARTTRALAALQAALAGRGPAAEAPVPERPADAYFDLATFVERMRERAQRRGIALPPDERFGFVEYAHAGPPAELISAVFRQRLIAQYLLETLFDAQPRQLVSVQRERPRARAARPAAATAAPHRPTGGESPDYLEVDPRGSARGRGFVEATVFRLTFVGQTAALRAWLNKLAEFERPLVVRSVEVEPAGAAAADPPLASPAPGAVAPLVPRSWSRFAVTVEWVDLAEPSG